MSIEYIKSDITKVERGFVIHGVNCRGAMNSGVARAIRNKWPEAYTSYMSTCRAFNQAKVDPRKMLGNIQIIDIAHNLKVVNAFTQVYYGRTGGPYAEPEAIEKCLHKITHSNLCRIVSGTNEKVIHMPRIGCGLGGLNWKSDVLPIVEKISKINSVHFIVHDIDK